MRALIRLRSRSYDIEKCTIMEMTFLSLRLLQIKKQNDEHISRPLD
jgi:hypothetical protein